MQTYVYIDGFKSGRKYRVRLRLFPDGGCGLAVNMKPIAILRADVGVVDSVRVVLDGSSVRTTILVTALGVRSGVPEDIDWSALPDAATQRHGRAKGNPRLAQAAGRRLDAQQ